MAQTGKTQQSRHSAFIARERRTRLARRSPLNISLRSYDRRTELPRILPLWPHELDDVSPEGRRNILHKLRRALRAERRRGIAGHWTYDLARHAELVRIYRLELTASGWRETDIQQRSARCDRSNYAAIAST